MLRTLTLMTLLAGMGLLALMLAEPHRFLAPDSFTYFRMARVFAESGLFYSYSGIDHATGIHPGYYLLLLPLAPVCGTLLPYCALILNALLIILALFVLSRAFGLIVALGASWILLLSQAAGSVHNGMESSLAFLLLAVVAWFLQRMGTVRSQLLLGAILGLLVFSRLDLIFFAAALIGLIALNSLIKNRDVLDTFRTACVIGAPCLLVLSATFAFNLIYDGTPLPLSGELKSSLPHLQAHWQSSLALLKPFPVALLAVGGFLIYRRGLLLGALFLSILALFLYNLLFVAGIGAWYGTLPVFALALVAGFTLKEFTKRVPHQNLFLLGAFALVLIAAYLGHEGRVVPDWIGPHERAAAYLQGREGTAGEYKDGVFAFYASMPVYSLTGLANNQEYVDALRTGTLEAYVRERDIRYVIEGSASSGLQVPGAREQLVCSSPIFEEGGASVYAIESCGFTPSAP